MRVACGTRYPNDAMNRIVLFFDRRCRPGVFSWKRIFTSAVRFAVVVILVCQLFCCIRFTCWRSCLRDKEALSA